MRPPLGVAARLPMTLVGQRDGRFVLHLSEIVEKCSTRSFFWRGSHVADSENEKPAEVGGFGDYFFTIVAWMRKPILRSSHLCSQAGIDTGSARAGKNVRNVSFTTK